MRLLLLGLIRLYQRFISPHKGFSCAYRCHTGRCSCSTLGFRAIRRLGAWRGLGVLRQRTALCGVAYRRFAKPRPAWAHQAQRGFCDASCDVGDCRGADCSWGDALDCAECGCDGWDARPGKRSQNPKVEQHVYIPPRRHARCG